MGPLPTGRTVSNSSYLISVSLRCSLDHLTCIITKVYLWGWKIVIELESNMRNYETEPIILGLGRPRMPLTSVMNSPQTKLNKGAYLNSQLIGPFISSTIPNQNLNLPYRIINQYIGRPFEIRIPTSEMAYLEKQIKQLKEKCQKLESQRKNGRSGKGKQLENTFEELTKSTKNIEEHLESVISGQCGFEKEGSQVSENEIEETIRSLQRKTETIQALEQKNRELEKTLAQQQALLQETAQRNEQLKLEFLSVSLHKQK